MSACTCGIYTTSLCVHLPQYFPLALLTHTDLSMSDSISKSCHPRHCKVSNPFSQVLRLRHICSSDDDFIERKCQLCDHLIRCGYNQITDQRISRDTSLIPKSTMRNSTSVVTFLPKLSVIATTLFPVLHATHAYKRYSRYTSTCLETT